MFRLAIDIGGTFTDMVLEGDGLSSLKVLTTPEAPEKAALEGSLALLSENNVEFADVSAVIHGTTLATNALIERRGARTALVTTNGFRDILEMGYERRFEQYDVNLELPAPLVPRELRMTVDERMDAYGKAIRAPQEDEIDAISTQLLEKGVEAVAIGFLHSTANDAHERQVADWLRARLPEDVTICLSSEVSPEIREYERFSTVAANAYVRPLMSRYLSRFDTAMRARGFTGEFLLMLSGGGLTTVDQAARVPIRLVESGPAGGVALGARVSREVGIAKVLAFDMGGTTAKICFLENAQPATARRFEVARAWRDIKGSGLPVRIPTTELVEIGAGGGSIARRDTLGRLAVGPKSAGAAPGPAAYGLGGSEPTITDANVVLGKLSPEGFAGGRLALRPELAVEAIREKVVGPLGMSSSEWAAAGITEIGEEAMANAARVHAVEQGKNVAAYTLMASGGAGPLHAVRLAEKLGISRVVIPAFAGVGSAVGFLSAPIAYEVARSVLAPLGRIDLDRLRRLQAEMAEEANAVVRPALASGTEPDITIAAELRYEGQGHALRIGLGGPVETAGGLEAMRQAFVETYRSVYGAEHSGNAIELVSLSLVASGPEPVVATVSDGSFTPRPATPIGTAEVFSPVSGTRLAFARYRRDDEHPGAVFTGPMLLVEDQTTTYAPAGWSGYMHALGHIVLEREGSA